MSLLDDARRLADDRVDPTYEMQHTVMCHWCPAESDGVAAFVHAPDCPWLSMPKIVAALEASERLCTALGLLDVVAHGNVQVGEDLIWQLQRKMDA